MAEQRDESQALETLRRYRAPEVVCGYLELQGTDKSLAILPEFHRLADLSLDDTTVTDAGLAIVAGIPSLTELSLSGTRISSAGLMCLQQLPRLERLHLSGISLTDEELQYVTQLRGLRKLSLADSGVTNQQRGTNAEKKSVLRCSRRRNLAGIREIRASANWRAEAP